MTDNFTQFLKQYYPKPKSSICLGGIIESDTVYPEYPLLVSLKTLNRHGLIAGATGTGKTKTIQVFAEQLALAKVPSLVMDIKGDLSGLSQRGEANEKIQQRQQQLSMSYKPTGFNVNFFSLDNTPGIKLRTTLTDFGATLFAKMLALNETQSSIITILFQYAKEQNLPLLDLTDIKKLISYAQSDAKSDIEQEYGGISSQSLKAILRKIIQLESQGGGDLFGEPAFDVNDLMQMSKEQATISVLRLMNLQDKPQLFSSYMLSLLTQLYRIFPEVGDCEKPKLVLFLDEAHLLFENASKALLNKLTSMVKLIRSKGIGLVFCTQSPKDIPEDILGQLGLKVQHALRAFSAKDRKAIKLIAENFPLSDFYETEKLLTTLGIGQALVCSLDEKGLPTPLFAAMMRTPLSRMGAISDAELTKALSKSNLTEKYKQRIDRESAKELLAARMKKAKQAKNEQQKDSQSSRKKSANEQGALEKLSKNTLFRQVIRTITREFSRAILLALGIKKKK